MGNEGAGAQKINWYPGHMAAAKRMMQENLKLIDIIIEIRDARIPHASGNPDIEKLDKPRIILLNKVDLADEAKTKQWLEYFRKKGISARGICARQRQNEIKKMIDEICADKAEYFRQRGLKRNMRALVAGIPNSGKSTLINSLCGQARAKTGDKPGVTRGKQWIKTDSVDLLDSPGLLYPDFADQNAARLLAFTGALNDEVLDLDSIALELIGALNVMYPTALSARYGIVPSGESISDYEEICRKRGFLLKKNEYDYSRCARVLLDEFRAGKLGKITLETPENG